MEEIRKILTVEHSEPAVLPEGSQDAHQPTICSTRGAQATATPTSLASRPTSLSFEPPNRAPIPLPPPLKPHWFYTRQRDQRDTLEARQPAASGLNSSESKPLGTDQLLPNRPTWVAFSLLDSSELEKVHARGGNLVTVCGGRYDVDLFSKRMYPVYWTEPHVIHVRRCSWFYKAEGESKYTPYNEDIAHLLEESYQKCFNLNKWNRQVDIGNGHYVKIYNANTMTHHASSGFMEEWGNVTEGNSRPRIVKRGADAATDVAFEAGESPTIDHLIFVVHGIGAVCDLRMRSVEECLDDFRSMSNQLVQTHYGDLFHTGRIGRIEFLPVSWHSKLHGETTGLDQKLHKITINTISRIREFSNDTILDALLYTSPVYCQTIVDHVGSELNRLHHLFRKRNPAFDGTVGLAGHSLGSLILYDILSHQRPGAKLLPTQASENSSSLKEPLTVEQLFGQLSIDSSHLETLRKADIDIKTLELLSESDLLTLGLPLGPARRISDAMARFPRKSLSRTESYTRAEFLVQGNEGTGQVTVNYPQLKFEPDCFFAMGSPIAMFIVVRGNETLGKNFRLPTCPRFFNIFHPYDPIAYRIEPLIDPSVTFEPVQIPHHKGRKRMHLEVMESFKKVSIEVKQKFTDAFNTVSALGGSLQRRDSEIRKEDRESLEQEKASVECHSPAVSKPDEKAWMLNEGRRVDYVLQEGPLESFNEYLSVLFSHACYWESEDTLLFMLKEHYSLRGIQSSQAAKASGPSLLMHSLYPLASPLSPSLDPATVTTRSENITASGGGTAGIIWNSISSVSSLSGIFLSRQDSAVSPSKRDDKGL